MATAPTIAPLATEQSQGPRRPARVAVSLPPVPTQVRQSLHEAIAEAFAPANIFVVAAEQPADNQDTPHLEPVLLDVPRSSQRWVLSAADYQVAAAALQKTGAEVVLVLNDESATPDYLRSLAQPILDASTDIVLPNYTLSANQGLVNSALISPLTHALYATGIRFPLPSNAALSARAAERIASSIQRIQPRPQPDTLVWPVAEAYNAGLTVQQTPAETRILPQPTETDFNTLFAGVASSLFADIEAKATVWQRSRATTFATVPPAAPALSNAAVSAETTALIESFRLAYSNLNEVWSLVLPPQSLLALKRLSAQPAETFRVAPELWARIVFDFVLAFHLRTINRGHLIGAFTSLYLAWAASHILGTNGDDARAAALAEETALAFAREKPYLLARWRWPDRFNP